MNILDLSVHFQHQRSLIRSPSKVVLFPETWTACVGSFVILNSSPRNAELNDVHFLFPQMDSVWQKLVSSCYLSFRQKLCWWTSYDLPGNHETYESLVNTGSHYMSRWGNILRWMDSTELCHNQKKSVYSCFNLKGKNYSSLHKCFLWWRSCCSNNMSFTIQTPTTMYVWRKIIYNYIYTQ